MLTARVEQRGLDPTLQFLQSTEPKPAVTRMVVGEQLLKCLACTPVDSWQQELRKCVVGVLCLVERRCWALALIPLPPALAPRRQLKRLASRIEQGGSTDPLLAVVVAMQGTVAAAEAAAEEAARCRHRPRPSQETKDLNSIINNFLIEPDPKPRATKQAWSLQDDLATAQHFRACMDRDIPVQLCAVCARKCRRCDVHVLRFADQFVGLGRLRADGPKTPAAPRQALTTFLWQDVRYCLLPAACDAVKGTAHVCTECTTELGHGKLPPASLVRIDTGPPPAVAGVQLPQLTHIEGKLLSTWRAFRFTVVCRANASEALRSNVVAFPSAPPDALLAVLCPPERIAECIQVVFIAATSSRAQIRALAAKTPALHVRGKVLVQWARHLSAAYAKHLDLPCMLPDGAVLAMYDALDGVPEQILMNAVSAATDEEAEELQAAFMHNRTGHNQHSTHHPEPEADPAEHPPAAAQVDSTQHTDPADAQAQQQEYEALQVPSVEMVFQPGDLRPSEEETAREQADMIAKLSGQRLEGRVLLSGAGRAERPCDDYDPRWLVLAHPMSFPNGAGGKPERMSLEVYMRIVLARPGFARHTYLLFDAFNIIQRHAANLHAHVHLRMPYNTGVAEQIGRLSMEDVQLLFSALLSGTKGAAFNNQLAGCADLPTVWLLNGALKSSGAKVLGTAQAFRALRSRAGAVWHAFQPFTATFNLNPADLCSPFMFRIAGHTYTVDAAGKGSLSSSQRWAIVNENADAAGLFHHLFMMAFVEAFLGWDLRRGKQVDRDCLFGVVTSCMGKYEASCHVWK